MSIGFLKLILVIVASVCLFLAAKILSKMKNDD